MKKVKKIKYNKKKSVPKADRLLPPKLVRLIVAVVAAVLLAIGVKVGFDIYDLKKQHKEAIAEKAALELRAAELEKQVEAMNTPEYLEQQARNILHMIKPGEILYIPPKSEVPDSNATGGAAGKPDEPTVEEEKP